MNNFGDVVWHGANGILLQPDYNAKFSIECMVTAKTHTEWIGSPRQWKVVDLPGELEGTVFLNNCCRVDGIYAFPPGDFEGNDLGWLCVTGDTPSECLQKAKDAADLLPDGLNADVDSLASIIQEIDSAEKEGIHFTNETLPEPSEAL